MKLVDKKTRKAIRKIVRKNMKKHGREIIASLATAVVSSLATLATAEGNSTDKRRSNLATLSDRVSSMFTGDNADAKPQPTSKKKHLKARKAAAGQLPAEVM